MNDNRVIKYENVRNESYQMINLSKNGVLETLLVHEFETDRGKDYLVVGQSKAGIHNINKEGIGWCNIISNVVSAYKNSPKTVLESNESTYYNVANIPNFYFTEEGFDLVSHKYVFTKDIIRTVYLDKNVNSVYNNYGSFDGNPDTKFMSFEYLEKNYTIKLEEYSKFDLETFVKYARANFIHLRNVYFSSPYKNEENDKELLSVDGVDRNKLEEQILYNLIMVIEAYNTLKNAPIKEQMHNRKK